MAPAAIASTRYPRSLASAAVAGSRLAAGFARAARAQGAAVPAADARAAALVDVVRGWWQGCLWPTCSGRSRPPPGAGRPHPLPRPRRPGAARDRAPPGAAALSRDLLPQSRRQPADSPGPARSAPLPTTTGSGTGTGPAPRLCTCCCGYNARRRRRRRQLGCAWGSPSAAWSCPLAAAEIVRLRAWLESPGSAAAAAAARAANRRRRVAYLPNRGCSPRARRRSSILGGAGRYNHSMLAAARRGGGHTRRLPPFAIGAGEGRDLARPAARLLLRREPRRGGGHLRRRRGPAGQHRGVRAADHGTVTGLRETPNRRIEAEVDPGWAGPVAAWGLPTVARRSRPAEASAPAPVSAAEIGKFGVTARRPASDGSIPRRTRPGPEGRFPSTSARVTAASSPRSPSPNGLPDLRRALGGGKLLKRAWSIFWVEGALAASPAVCAGCSPPRLAPLPARARAGGAGGLLRPNYDKLNAGQACWPARETPSRPGRSEQIELDAAHLGVLDDAHESEVELAVGDGDLEGLVDDDVLAAGLANDVVVVEDPSGPRPSRRTPACPVLSK